MEQEDGMSFMPTPGSRRACSGRLNERIARAGMQDKFGQILVPMEEVVEMKSGQKNLSGAQVFSGIRAGRNGNDRRHLASGEKHGQGHRLHRRHVEQADADHARRK